MASHHKSYDIVVDTQPMARKMDGVSVQVNNVKQAVVTMQSAVILAETEAAAHVCNNINQGFFTLIRSQISQKIAQRRSEVESILLELQMQSKLLLGIKKRMQSDYHMIARRYSDLFGSLNKILHNRIVELDRPAVNIVERDVQLFNNRINRLSAAVPTNQLESLSLSQTLAASHTKQNGMKTISAIQSFIGEMNRQKYKSERILLDKIVRTNERKYLPVLIASQNDQSVDSEITHIFLPEVTDPYLRHHITPEIKSHIYQDVDKLSWTAGSKANKEKVSGYFNQMIAASDMPERVKKMMVKMYNANYWQALKA